MYIGYNGGASTVNFVYIFICPYWYGCQIEFTPKMTEFESGEYSQIDLKVNSLNFQNKAIIISGLRDLGQNGFVMLDPPGLQTSII